MPTHTHSHFRRGPGFLLRKKKPSTTAARAASRRTLSAEQLQALVPLVRAGDSRATEAMLGYHERLFSMICRAYLHKGLDFADLMQETSIGFIQAVRNKYRDDMGASVTTYCLHWADQACQRAVQNNGSSIRVPVWLHEQLHVARRDNQPMDEQSAPLLYAATCALNTKNVKVQATGSYVQAIDVSLRNIDGPWAEPSSKRQIGLGGLVVQPQSLRDLVFGPAAEMALGSLTPVQRNIVTWHLDDNTWAQIAEKLAVETEGKKASEFTVRVMYKQAIRKMRTVLAGRKMSAADFF